MVFYVNKGVELLGLEVISTQSTYNDLSIYLIVPDSQSKKLISATNSFYFQFLNTKG